MYTAEVDLSLIKSENKTHSVYFVNRYSLTYARILSAFSHFGKVVNIEMIDLDDVKGILVHYATLEAAMCAVKRLRGQRMARLRPHPRARDSDEEDEQESVNWFGCRRRLIMG